MIKSDQPGSLRLLLEAGRLLSAQLELEELLAMVLKLAAKVAGAETASLLLWDPHSRELYFHTALGLGPAAAQVRLPLGQGIAGCVAQSRRPEIINDVRADRRWSPRMDKKSGFVTRSILAVPMLLKGRLVGVVEAINKRRGAFSDEDRRVLEAFASQAAVAVENAALFSSLQEERRKLHTIFTEMTDGALLADAAGRIVLSNEAARKFFAVGKPPDALTEAFAGMTMDPPLAELLAAGRQPGRPSREFTARREKPQALILSGRATRTVLETSGRRGVPGWLVVVRDVTEATQKLALQRTFLSLISHKLRTPLASITGFAELLMDRFRACPPEPAAAKAAQAIAEQGQKLAGLVDKLLRFMTIESPETTLELAAVSLDEVVAQALESLQGRITQSRAAISFAPAGPAGAVRGDRRFLHDVIKNLVENAVKFADKPETKIRIRVQTDGDEVLLSVGDNGPGIPPEEQDRIFSRFHQIEGSYTGQIEGWGLGLPYVRKVAVLHGGSVRLASKLGQGTTVIVALPRSRP